MCRREYSLLKYLIIIITFVCQSCLFAEAGTLSRISTNPESHLLLARGEGLNTAPLSVASRTRPLAALGSGFDLFREAINLVADHYVEKFSTGELLKMVMDKLVLIVLPQCVEGAERCPEENQECFVRNIEMMSERCNLDITRLLFAGLNISLQELDPNSCVMDTGMLKELEIGTSGKFGGVGMVVSARQGDYVVVSPFDGSPAYKAGIKAGDTILEIDGQSLHGLPLLEVLRKVRGPAGTVMSVRVMDKKSRTVRHIRLQRRMIRIPPVRFLSLGSQVGYLRIVNFQKGTAAEVYKALGQGAGESSGLILDLRDNPGGLFEEAIQVANLFKTSGIITSVKGRENSLNRDFRANGQYRLPQIPLVILINKGTASASEILAGALQGLSKVLVMGERSFGKASVQLVFPLNRGMAVRLTTAHYYTADGRDIDGKGLEPDAILDDSDESLTKGRIDLLSSEQLKSDSDIRAALAYLHSGARPTRSPFSSLY